MDPQATWTELLEALAEGQKPAALEAAAALKDWLRRGGFPPQTLAEFPQDDPLHRVIALAVCNHVLLTRSDAGADG